MQRLILLGIFLFSCKPSTESKVDINFREHLEVGTSRIETEKNPLKIAFKQIEEPFKLDTFSTETYRFWHGEGFGYGHYTLYTISKHNLVLKIKEFEFETLTTEIPHDTKAIVHFENSQQLNQQEWQELKKLLEESYFFSLEPTSNYELAVVLDGHSWSLSATNFMSDRQINEFGSEHNRRTIYRQAPFKGKLGEVANFFLERNPNRKESL